MLLKGLTQRRPIQPSDSLGETPTGATEPVALPIPSTASSRARRFTRLTNAFSKKLENHEHAVALYFMDYKFARIHQTLRVTPAMEAGVSNHVWSLQEIIGVSPQPVEIKDNMNDLQTTVKGRTLRAWISSSTSTKQLHQPLTSQNDATNILPFSFSSK